MKRKKPKDDRQPKCMAESLARRACGYSRELILKSSTQLINNRFSRRQRANLERSIKDLRYFCKQDPFYTLEIDEEIKEFYRTVAFSKKFSIGNCYEMALMALDYVINSTKTNLNAEVYQIVGGDHVFLVIGRNPESESSQPETWGGEAYICDPWANQVFKASEYLSKVKNFYREKKNYLNHIEDFNPKRHRLDVIPHMNKLYISRANSEEHLHQLTRFYEKRMGALLRAMEKLAVNLAAIIERLNKKYPDNPEKRLILEKMASQIHLTIEIIKEETREVDLSLTYKALRASLENSLNKSFSSYAKTFFVSDADRRTLMTYYNRDSFATKCLMHFKIPPKTVRATQHAFDEAKQMIQNDEILSFNDVMCPLTS